MQVEVIESLLEAIDRLALAARYHVEDLENSQEYSSEGKVGEIIRGSCERARQDIAVVTDWVKRMEEKNA